MPPETQSLQDQIDLRSEDRRRLNGRGTRELDSEIESLYARLREAKARKLYGTREEISRRARVERELEKAARSIAD